MIDLIEHYALEQCKKRGGGGVEPYALKAYEPKYTELKLNEDNIFKFDKTGEYTPQGGAIDRTGKLLFRALVKADEEPAILQKIDLNTGEILKENNVILGHANDMTYNQRDGFLYIAHSSSTSIVYKVDPETLEIVDTLNFGPQIWGLAHENVNNIYALGNVGAGYVSVYNNNKGLPDWFYRNKMQNAFSGGVRQCIECDENYIYIAIDNAYSAQIENEKGSRIYVYTWNGMFIKSIFINIAEIEFLAVDGQTFYIGTYEGRDARNQKSGYIYKVDFDLYPGQTVLTGRPTDVSGGLNNLQRLPEGTPVRIFNSEGISAGDVVLDTINTKLKVSEDAPFRWLKFRFKGANSCSFDWFPVNNGVVCLREFDITDALEDTTIRFREMRLKFNAVEQKFVIEDNYIEEIKKDLSENTISITKNPAGVNGIVLEQILGVV